MSLLAMVILCLNIPLYASPNPNFYHFFLDIAVFSCTLYFLVNDHVAILLMEEIRLTTWDVYITLVNNGINYLPTG